MQKPLRRSLATLIALALGAAAPISAARAADYPTRPVTVVVPYAPGGQTDAFARIMAEALRESLGQPVIVDNKPGAGTMIGSEYVARAAPDGYTILVATPGVVVAPSLYNSTKYDVVKDFQPITLACSILMVLSVNPNKMPVKDVGGFISALKANPDKYFYGTAGAGSSPHLIGEWFKKLTGTQMTHVAFKGSAPAVTALLSGQIDLMFDAYASQAELAKSGGIKILAVTSDQRSDLIPDVPTLKESGVTDLVVLPWTGVIAPKGLDPAVTARLDSAIRNALTKPSVAEKLAKIGLDCKKPMDSAQFKAFLAPDVQMWKNMLSISGAKLE